MTDQETIFNATARLVGGHIEIYESHELKGIVVKISDDPRVFIYGYPTGREEAYRQAKVFAKLKSEATGYPIKREILSYHNDF